MRARLGQERAAELARDDLARGSREDVGLHGHLGPKSLPGRSRRCEHTKGPRGAMWRAEEWVASSIKRSLHGAPDSADHRRTNSSAERNNSAEKQHAARLSKASVCLRELAPRGAGGAQGITCGTCDGGWVAMAPRIPRGRHAWLWATGATGSHWRRQLNLTFKPFKSEKIHS